MRSTIRKRLSLHAGITAILILGLLIYALSHNQFVKKNTVEQENYQEVFLRLKETSNQLENWKNLYLRGGLTENESVIARLESLRQNFLIPRLDSLYDNPTLARLEGRKFQKFVNDSLDRFLRQPTEILMDEDLSQLNYPIRYDSVAFSPELFQNLQALQTNQNAKNVQALANNAARIDPLILQFNRWAALSKKKADALKDRTVNRSSQFIGVLIVGTFFLLLFISFAAWDIIRRFRKGQKTINEQLSSLENGDLVSSFSIDPEYDETKKCLVALSAQLENLRKISREIGEGDFNTDIKAFHSGSTLAKALEEMKKSLSQVAQEENERNWINKGLNEFSDLLRQDSSSLQNLCDDATRMLVKYADANQASLFLVEDTDEEQILRLRSTYAFDRKKYQDRVVEKGDGLVGECWAEKEKIWIKNVPDEFVNIGSGMGDARPKNILIMPLLHNDEINGVLEIASFHSFDQKAITFLETATENMSSTLSMVYASERTRNLLEESQGITEQMKAQEEEMRQNMEELQATQEEADRKTKEMESRLTDYQEREEKWKKEKDDLLEIIKSEEKETRSDLSNQFIEKEDKLQKQSSSLRQKLRALLKN